MVSYHQAFPKKRGILQIPGGNISNFKRCFDRICIIIIGSLLLVFERSEPVWAYRIVAACRKSRTFAHEKNGFALAIRSLG